MSTKYTHRAWTTRASTCNLFVLVYTEPKVFPLAHLPVDRMGYCLGYCAYTFPLTPPHSHRIEPFLLYPLD